MAKCQYCNDYNAKAWINRKPCCKSCCQKHKTAIGNRKERKLKEKQKKHTGLQ